MISSRANPKVKHVRRLQADRGYRALQQAYVVEGNNALAEFHHHPHLLKHVFYTQSWLQSGDSRRLLDELDGQKEAVTDAVMAAMSDLEMTPGLLAEVRMQPLALPQPVTLLLVLDAIADPGNLGTILRTAAAAGVDGVLLSPGCVDAYNPKVVRGAMGAHLRVPLRNGDWSEIRQITTGLERRLAAADGAFIYTEIDWQAPVALIIGSEAHGASGAAQELCDRAVRIPMSRRTESINAAVATAVILFEAARQRAKANAATQR